MFSKKKNHIFLFFVLIVSLLLSLFIFSTPWTATAQSWSLLNPWTQSLSWSPFQNLWQTTWQSPWQNQWTNPFQSQWQSPWQNPWQQPLQNLWQQPLQNPWQQPWQNPWQQSWQNPFQNPWQNAWQNPFQNPWQNPWQQPQYQNADVNLDLSDDGESVSVATGETISIILESNATTGYKWVLNTTELDSSIVSNTSSKYFPANNSLVGSGGSEQWIFEAETPGTTTIKLNYKRIWETSIEDTFEIEVIVE